MNVQAGRRYAYIDVLRGMACILVLLHHSLRKAPVMDGWAHLPLRIVGAVARCGWLGVSLFLVLSGFCLYFPLMRSYMAQTASVDIASFARRRARRILPPYYAALAFCIMFIVAGNYYHDRPIFNALSVVDVVRHVFLIHNFWPESFSSINIVFWSLALEAQLYVAFPLLVYLIARHGFSPVVMGVLVLSLAWQMVVYANYGPSLDWTVQLATPYHALPARLFEFLAGMVAAHFVTRPQPNQVRIAVAVIAILIAPAIFYVHWVSRFGPLLDQTWGLIFAALIVAMGQISNHRFEFPSALGVLNWVGGISFSLYLVHVPVFKLFPWRDSSDSIIIAIALAKIGVAIGVAYVFYLLFEKPFLRTKQAKPMPIAEGYGVS